MPDMKKYWARINAMEATFPPDGIFITTITNFELEDSVGWRVGVTMSALPRLAAQRIVEGSHRLATPEEVAIFKGEQKQREEACQAQTDLARDHSSMSVSFALAEALKLLGTNGGKSNAA